MIRSFWFRRRIVYHSAMHAGCVASQDSSFPPHELCSQMFRDSAKQLRPLMMTSNSAASTPRRRGVVNPSSELARDEVGGEKTKQRNRRIRWISKMEACMRFELKVLFALSQPLALTVDASYSRWVIYFFLPSFFNFDFNVLCVL